MNKSANKIIALIIMGEYIYFVLLSSWNRKYELVPIA